MNSERTAFLAIVTVAFLVALFITPATAGEVTANSTGTSVGTKMRSCYS